MEKMQMLINLVTTLITLLTFFGAPMQASDNIPYDKIAIKLINNASVRLSKKHNMDQIGTKQGMMGCVKFIGLRFQVYRKLSKEEARSIAVDCAQELLAEINQNEAIRKDLQVYPFDLKHIDIIIFISPPDRGTFYHPDLAIVSVCNGEVEYNTNDPDHKYRYKSEEIETFEDAVKILQNQVSPNQPK